MRKFSYENMRIPRDTTCEEGEIPLVEFQSPSLETTITTEIPTVDKLTEQSIALPTSEGEKLISIIVCCQEMTRPHFFSTIKFDYKVKRDVSLAPSKYFNKRLLNYSHYASESDYIFFAHSVM